MILEWTITKPAITEQATIEVYPTWGYDSISKQVIVTCKVTTGGEVFEKQYLLTPEQTELWGEDDNYVINMICQSNWFTKTIESIEEELKVEEPVSPVE